MKNKCLFKIFLIAALHLVPLSSFAAGDVQHPAVWTSQSDRIIGAFPAFGTQRVLRESDGEPAIYSVNTAKLVTGGLYVAMAPFSGSLSTDDPAAEVSTVMGGLPLVFKAGASELRLSLIADPDYPGTKEMALRGIVILPFRSVLLAIILRLLVLAVLVALLGFSFARLSRSAVQVLPHSALLVSALFVGIVFLLPLASFAGLRSASVLSSRIAPVCIAAFLAAAALAFVSLFPRRLTFSLFFAYAAAASLAAAASASLSVPPALPAFVFSAFSFLAFIASFIAALSLRARREAVFALSAALSSSAFALSSIAWDQELEAALACAGLFPLLLAALRPPAPVVHLDEEAAVVLPVPALEDVSILTRFIPKEFLSILNKGTAADLLLGDHVKQDMTIFFSDIRKFTTLSEGLTPEENFKFINSYFARIVPVVNAFGGFVDKYVGDAIMALFPNVDGADQAVRAGIEMQKKIVEYNGHRANCGYPPLSMGIGLHTGTLMLGVVGVEDRMQNTVISDAVNLASRLESITKVFNVSMAISEETFKSLQDPGDYYYRFIGKVRVKGKVEPVSVFEIFDGVDPELFERKMKASRFFEQGMMSYYQKEFTGAMYFFRKVLESLPEDGAATFYLDNCISKTRA